MMTTGILSATTFKEETEMDYSKLQNGSDIRGVALEGIEGQHINLTEQVCKDIGRGFALWLMKKTSASPSPATRY